MTFTGLELHLWEGKKWQGHFHFAKGTSFGKSYILWETFEGAPRSRLGATEAIASMVLVLFQAYFWKRLCSATNRFCFLLPIIMIHHEWNLLFNSIKYSNNHYQLKRAAKQHLFSYAISLILYYFVCLECFLRTPKEINCVLNSFLGYLWSFYQFT